MRPKGSIKTPGSGRKAGTPNRNTLQVADLCAFHRCSPAEILIQFAMSTDPADKTFKYQAAKELSLFIYPKLQTMNVDANINMDVVRKVDEYAQMSKEQKILLIETELKRLKGE